MIKEEIIKDKINFKIAGRLTYTNNSTQLKLSSGYWINWVADDAAGLSISEKMCYQIRGLDRRSKNTEEGISFIQVADGIMQEIHSII